ADKDWSNVGQSPAWIDRDERCHVQKFAVAPDAVVFTIRKGLEGEIQVVGTTPVHVTLAETEEAVIARLPGHLDITYCRWPVTDHCAPGEETVRAFVQGLRDVPRATWVHFHCHGGDGRTTTFLTMYDMLRAARAHPPKASPPDLVYFRQRQLRLFHWDP